MIPCSTIQDLRTHLQKGKTNLGEYDIIFIHTGVNNIDTEDGKSVADNLVDLVHQIRARYSAIKVIVSEITPRQIHRDEQVQACNKILRSSLAGQQNVTLAFHGNLRNDTWSFHKKGDDKHFAEIPIALFASNIKVAFRKSIGLSLDNKKKQKKPSQRVDPLKVKSVKGSEHRKNKDFFQEFTDGMMNFLRKFQEQ